MRFHHPMPNPSVARVRFSAPLFILVGLVHCAMLALAWPRNPGSGAPLIFFAAGALLMVVSAAVARSYSALCLAAFLWLGLWLKFIVHLFYLSALVEPIGAFDGSLAQYDTVMLASGTACFAAAISFVLALMLRLGTILARRDAIALQYRVEWSQVWIYLALLGLCFAIAFVNSLLGIFQIGLVPRTILPKPGNAVISLFLTTGYFFTFSYLIFCDLTKRRSIVPGLITLIVSAAVMSSTLLSRGVVVFHLAAVMLALAAFCWRQRTWQALLVFACAIALGGLAFFATIGYVERGREISFAPRLDAVVDDGTKLDTDAGAKIDEQLGAILKFATAANVSKTARIISQLAVGRWIGVEGAMVAAGNSSNSPSLIVKMLAERSTIGKVGIYQHLSNSVYVTQNGHRFQFATLPGPVGAFLFGGSVAYVFVGVLALCLLAMAFEKLSQILTRSEFVTCFVAVFSASCVSQFGLTPVSLLPQIIYILILLLIFWGLRSLAPRLSGTALRHLLPRG